MIFIKKWLRRYASWIYKLYKKSIKDKCEICGKQANELFTIKYFTESGLSACEECCLKNKNN